MTDTLLWYATRGAGGVSLVLFSAVMLLGVLSARRFEARGWPRFLTVGLHRNISLLALVFLLMHIVTAVVDPFTHLGWAAAVIPFSSYYRTVWLGLGVVAVELMVAVVLTSLVREHIGLRAWRLVHWMAYASWPVAVLHGFGTGTDAWSAWLFGLQILCIVAVIAAVVARLVLAPADRLAGERSRFRAAARIDSERPR